MLVEHELLEREQVVADVLADRGVRAAAGLDGADARGGSASLRSRNSASSRVKMSLVTTPRRHAVAQRAAQREHQRGLAAADRAADADRERAAREVAASRRLALVEVAGVSLVAVIVSMS